MDWFAPSHMLIILVIVMIFFGAGKLPDVFRQFGKGIKEFKDASGGVEKKGGRAERDAGEDEDDDQAAFEEFKRKRNEAKRLTASRVDAPASRELSVLRATEDADGDGDNDDAGYVAPKSRKG